jgi:UrcA family protein
MNSSNRRKILALTAIAGFSGICAAGVSDTSAIEVQTMTLTYRPELVATPIGARQFHSKLRLAARKVCTSGDADPRGEMRLTAHCASAALTQAVTDVNIAALDEVHGLERGSVSVLPTE